MINKLPKVVIIGAGPSGILCCKHLKGKADIICFEGNSSIGGQWLPQQIVQKNQQTAYQKYYGTHFTSLYQDLQANIPQQNMTWKEFPHRKEYKSGFLMANDFLEYQRDYVKHFELEQYMRFNSFVKDVSLVKNLDKEQKQQITEKQYNNEKFIVTVCDTWNCEDLKEQFLADYVLVCNGHNIKPHMPYIQNQDKFQGKIIHSHDLLEDSYYNQFAGKTVIVQGIRASGQDTVYKLTKCESPPNKILWLGGAEKHAINFKKSVDYKEWIEQNRLEVIPERIQNFENKELTNTVITNKQTELNDIDYIIQSTGYHYYFPFLNERDSLIQYEKIDQNQQGQEEQQVNWKLFGPLYKRMFSIQEPNLIFVGLMERVRGLQILIERIAMVASLKVQGKIQLPSQEDMLKDWQEDLEELRERDPQMKGLLQIDMVNWAERKYVKQLADLAGMEMDEKFCQQIEDLNKIINSYTGQGNQPSLRKLKFQEYDYVSKNHLL